jgi:hypothetical protein
MPQVLPSWMAVFITAIGMDFVVAKLTAWGRIILE